MDGRCFLFVANFGDRHGKRYNSSSSFWMYAAEENFSLSCETSEDSSCYSSVYDSSRGHFHFVGSIPTFGATDGEFFELSGRYYLAVSEEGDLGLGDMSAFNSRVYMLQLKDLGQGSGP